jgi:hypothetical protein
MNKNDLHILSMWKVVRQHLDAYHSLWASLKPFANASAALTGAIEDARATLKVQGLGTKGMSEKRRALQAEAIYKVVGIARCTGAYALDTGNHVLLEAVHAGKGVLSQYGQNVLAATLHRIMATAMEHSEVLVDYGVSADVIDDALETIALLEEAQTAVRGTITAKKAVTGHVPEIMGAGRLALMKLDRLIHLFERAKPEFVSGYRTSRSIIHTHSRRQDNEPARAA